MGFNSTGSALNSTAKTQADLVAERIEAKPEILTEDIETPGIAVMHEMSDTELVDFLAMVLKMRRNIFTVEITLGEEFKQTERQANVPNSGALHMLEYREVAQVLALALRSGDQVMGLRAQVSTTGNATEGATSRIFLKESTEEIDPKSEKFLPVLRLTYKP